jgi:hypothetical protein
VKGYNPCLLLLSDSGKDDLFGPIEEKAGEKRTILEKNEKPRNMETRKEQRCESKETRGSPRISQSAHKNLIPYPDYLSRVIELSTGATKKKPMTKKEREEKRRKHKEKRLKK